MEAGPQPQPAVERSAAHNGADRQRLEGTPASNAGLKAQREVFFQVESNSTRGFDAYWFD